MVATKTELKENTFIFSLHIVAVCSLQVTQVFSDSLRIYFHPFISLSFYF